MARTETTSFMNLCMIRNGDKVVVIDRKKEFWPGITFPGGHVEKNEPFADAVIREVFEETGLTIKSPRLCGMTDWCEDDTRYVILLYAATVFSGELVSSDEGNVWWESIKALPNLNLTAGMPEYLEVFFNENLSELYYRQEDADWIAELK